MHGAGPTVQRLTIASATMPWRFTRSDGSGPSEDVLVHRIATPREITRGRDSDRSGGRCAPRYDPIGSCGGVARWDHPLMVAFVIVLYVLTFAAEVVGFVLLVKDARSSTVSLRKWQAANPNSGGSSYGQVLDLGPVIEGLLGNPRRRRVAVGLIGAGIALGLTSNLLSLYV